MKICVSSLQTYCVVVRSSIDQKHYQVHHPFLTNNPLKVAQRLKIDLDLIDIIYISMGWSSGMLKIGESGTIPLPSCYEVTSCDSPGLLVTTSQVQQHHLSWRNGTARSSHDLYFKSKCTNIKYQYIIPWFHICRCSFYIKGKNFLLRLQMLLLYTDGKIWKLSISTTDHWSSPWGRCWLALPESPVEYWSFLVNPPVPGRHYRRLGGPPQICPSLLGLFQLLDVTVY